MVLDTKSHIAFHTHMTSVEQNGQYVFEKSEAERREIHADEAGKLAYLVDKFFITLAEGQKILVFKQNRVIAPEVAQAILAAVAAYGDCSLLYVDPQRPGEVVGSVEKVSDRLYRGVIDRFAPYDQANDISIDAWTKICAATAKLVAE